MKLLQVIGTLNPAYGGPIESLRQVTATLQALGHQPEVITLDAPTAPWLKKFPGVVHALGPSYGTYRLNFRLVNWLRQHAGAYDAIIVRGIWQYQSFGTWLASRRAGFPYFVFVHGALNPWFRQTYPLKHAKKWLYWPWAEYRVLRDAAGVLFTSEAERVMASRSFELYKAREIVVNYGTSAPVGDPGTQKQLFFDKFPQLRGKRLLLFLGRIHPVKACDLLLEAFARSAAKEPGVHLVLAGPDKDGWNVALKKQAEQLGISNRITWTGMLEGDLKWGAFYASEVFVLPSHSENFGMVVAEALACSLPVLITDKVNIWREIGEYKAGMIEPDTLEGIGCLLKNWLALSDFEKKQMSINAQKCFMERFEMQFVSRQFIKTMEENIKKIPK